jgi:hypothetical protein
MKLLFSVFMLLHVAVCNSQDMRVALSAKKEKLYVSLNYNNLDRTFSFKNTKITATDYFTATVLDEEIDTSWRRSFTIHNNTDSIIASLKNTGDDKYSISLKELISKLQAGNQYYLYTIALPVDLQKQKLVKVVRRMVCKIILKS